MSVNTNSASKTSEAAEQVKVEASKPLGSPMKMEAKFEENPWFTRFREAKKEAGQLQGSISAEVEQISPEKEITKQVIQGAEFVGEELFMRHFVTAAASFIIPKITPGLIHPLSAGAFTTGSSLVTGSTVLLNQERGQKVTWTRSYLEDAGYDVMSEQSRVTGQLIKADKVQLGINVLTGSNVATYPCYTGAAGVYTSTLTAGAITMAEFNNALYKAEARGFGKVDTVLVSTNLYYQLLNLEDFTSALYNGGADVMGSGVLKTTFGVDIIKTDNLQTTWVTGSTNGNSKTDWLIALNRNKVLALVERRGVTIEPYSRPETNDYGYIASARYTVAPIWANAGLGPFWIALQHN